MAGKLADIEVELVHATAKAILVRSDPDVEPVWIPLSVVYCPSFDHHTPTDIVSGEIIEITMPEAMAIDKELI